MEKPHKIKHEYAYCNILSAFSSLLALMLPILTSLAVDRVMFRFSLRSVLPFIILIFAIQTGRTFLRMTISKYVGDNERAPLFWLQHRLGNWLWWVEPLLKKWGALGRLIQKFGGKNGIPRQIAISVSLFFSDTFTTLLSGYIYYFTQSYILSVLSWLLLPMLTILPVLTKKMSRHSQRARRLR